MDIAVQPGGYVVAVSGGVDSVVLLALLQQKPGLHLTVAHFDHGIREDSAEDRHLVQELAKKYDLPFVYDEGHLGAGASEATARKARYVFLQNIREKTGARAIITAHHQDDVIETALLNLIRGTGRTGLTALRSHDGLVRPLLAIPKKDLITYANTYNLIWREDSTNQDLSYKRNYIRHKVATRMTEMQRHQLLIYITELSDLNHRIDQEITNQLHMQPQAGCIVRRYFNRLPHHVALEITAAWLRQAGIRDFDTKTLQRIVIQAKTLQPGHRVAVISGYYVSVTKKYLALKLDDR